ncbi:MAG TPA: 16S rRNA (adenine(1518)-N(6)/adenine(1519)-N(6))-dimethyltransferase RsmA [Longimicrobiaceae bacterium]
MPPPPPREGRPAHRAKRSLGQNFLIDPNLQRRIVDAVQPDAEDEVMEIGPGQGALTRHLAGRVRRLVLVELDRDLAARLREQYAGRPDVEMIEGDVLELKLEDVTTDVAALKVIGNIPYNITTPIVFSLLERRPRPRMIVLMVQREVAERMAAAPGGKDYGALAVGVQSVATVQRVLSVGRRAFRPVPDVDSAVVRIVPRTPLPLSESEEMALRELTRRAFGQRRKQFQKILRDSYRLDAKDIEELERSLGFDLRQRPESFAPGEFVRLARALPPPV